MTVLSIISEALQSIPPKARKGLYAVYAIAVITAGVLAVANVETGKLNDVLLYVGGFLGVQASANVATTTEDVVEQLDEVQPADPPLPGF